MTKRIITIICFCSFFNSGKSQIIPEYIILTQKNPDNDFTVGKVNLSTPIVKSLKDYFQIIDTIDFADNTTHIVKVEGCKFQFNLNIHRDSAVSESGEKQILKLESRIAPFHLWEYNITGIGNTDLVLLSQELRNKPYDNLVLRTAYQTCISYALEGIFRSYGIDPEPFFFRRSAVAEFNDLEIILKSLFIKVETLENVKKRTLKKSKKLREEQLFILFRNSKGEPIHACFNLYGRTWTKNGMESYTSQPSPYCVIEKYNTKKKINSNNSDSYKELAILCSVSCIEIYQLNQDIFK